MSQTEPVPNPPMCFRNPALTVDAAVFRIAGFHPQCEVDEIVLIRRGREPHAGAYAFPGGFVDYGENPEAAAVRELEEECSVHGCNAGLVAVRGNPGRDPRKHTVTICYAVSVADFSSLAGADDAASAHLIPISTALDSAFQASMAFDHGQLMAQVLDWFHNRGGRDSLLRNLHCQSSEC
eukprot:ANDGO_03072.mRNA.1 ADP-ribose pyrophosphatase